MSAGQTGSGLKVAFSHDWLNGMRGGEKCLEALAEIYPDAELFTLFLDRRRISTALLKHTIHVSSLQNVPGVLSAYRYCLPFFPAAIRSFGTPKADLVISTSHCVAKGLRKGPGAKHLCYCFTPMRYAWLFFEDYFGGRDPLSRFAIKGILRSLRRWDVEANTQVDSFVAISKHVQKRILDFYDREAKVIYPPVDTEFYTPDATETRGDAYLIVSALVPYKRADLAVRALKRMGRKLVVIGDGPERAALQKMAGPHTLFLGRQPDEILRDHYRRTRALIFPGEEDFGIVPVEAQSCGAPVIAFARGGALETVNERTGVFFNEPSEDSLIDAIERLESRAMDPAEIRANVLRFGRRRFQDQMIEVIQKLVPKLS